MPASRLFLSLALAASVVGCQAGSGARLELSSAMAGRAVELVVSGPGQLASAGQILSDAGAELWVGNHIITDAGAELTAPVSPWRLAAVAGFAPVAQAEVQLMTLAGQAVGSPVRADAQGVVNLKSLPGGEPLAAVAAFKTGGKVYRMATVISPDAQLAPVALDPINTLVEARVSQLLGPKTATGVLSFQRLKQVWTICNAAGVTVDASALQANQPDGQIFATLSRLWQQAIDNQVTSQADKAVLQGFITDLQATATTSINP